jgi:rhamnogalacturonan acetylesterase
MFSIILSLLPFLALAKDHQPSPSSEWKTPTAPAHHTIPTIFLAGDSKMAPGGGGNGTEGWGQYLHYSFSNETVYINNSAIAGRSARSYTREGRFQKIADALKRDDWVVIEFGTNDGGSPYPASSDNGRADCPGYGIYYGASVQETKGDNIFNRHRNLSYCL